MKGVFNLGPPRPGYTATWDVLPVLVLLKSMYPLHSLSLKEITFKLVMFMALTQATRVQILHLLSVTGISFLIPLVLCGCGVLLTELGQLLMYVMFGFGLMIRILLYVSVRP